MSSRELEGADMLIHEVYAMPKYEKVSDQIETYFQSFHTSTTQLAEIANRANPRRLIPIHMLGYQGLP